MANEIPDNLIPFPEPSEDDEPIVRERGPMDRFDECRHGKYWLNEVRHMAVCSLCKQELDPFWVLKEVAGALRRQKYRDAHIKQMHAELTQARLNSEAKGKFYSRPTTPKGGEAWDIFEQCRFIMKREYPDVEQLYMYRQGSEWYVTYNNGFTYSVSYARQVVQENARGKNWK